MQWSRRVQQRTEDTATYGPVAQPSTEQTYNIYFKFRKLHAIPGGRVAHDNDGL
jgi:hypothetical protein